MHLEQYLSSMPNIQTWDEGKTWNTGGFERFHFEPLHGAIVDLLPPAPSFIETGAGNSTIFFLLHNPAKVVSIAPDAALFRRIEDFCEGHGIATGPLAKHVDCSEWALPPIAREAGLLFDFALIDGDHSVEREIIDFFYMNHLLKKGGLLMIDDMNVPSSKEVVRLIRKEADFRPVLDLRKALVFQKLSDRPTLRAWCDQAYIKEEMAMYASALDPFAVNRPTADEMASARAFLARGELAMTHSLSYRAVKKLY